jgi:hypothetical protein
VNEIRDIVARMMEAPQPPLRPAAEVLDRARRTNRRRNWRSAAGASAVTLVLALAVVGLSRLTWLPTDGPPMGIAAPSVPVAAAAPAHGQRMTQVLVASVPAGYATAPPDSFSDLTAADQSTSDGRVRLLAASVVRVFAGSGAGELYAYLVQDGRLAPDDVCAGEVAGCNIMIIDDVTVRVVTLTDQDRGQKFEATRFLAGGRLVVGAWQGSPGWYPPSLWAPDGQVTWSRPPLAAPLLDARAVAGLAADPAMLPA